MSSQQDAAARFMVENIRPPDRRGMPEFLEEIRFALPGSLRSQRFRLAISPWLELPMRFCDDPQVRRLTAIAAVQSSKSTLGEAFIVKSLATDPGNMLYNWEDDEKAEEIWNERIEKTVRDATALAYRIPSKKIRQRKREIQFTDGMYLRMQGAKAKGNRQSKSVRYLVNEEVKDWEAGALTDMRKRVTAAWNSFELNISPGGIIGDELETLWKESSQHVLHFVCPSCGHRQIPTMKVEKDKPGGLHLCDPRDGQALEECKTETGYDYRAIQRHLYYECAAEGCGHRWKDTPPERERLAATAEYICMNPLALPTDKGVKWHALVVPWIPWLGLIQEFHKAIAAAKYGDLSLLIEFVQKREAEFWNTERVTEDDEELTLSAEIKKSRDGMDDKQFRIMTADKQRGEVRRGETPHYWVVARDWKPGKSVLLWEGRIDTDEDLETLREELDVLPVFVWVDSGDGMTMIDVYRMCAKFGFVAVKGEDKSWYNHIDAKTGKTSRRRYSPDQNAVVTLEDGRQVHVPLVLYSKQGIRDLLHYIRTASDFDFQTPEDVSTDYIAHNKAEKLIDWVTPRTGQVIKIWKQYRPRNDLFVCECYQCLVSDIVGVVGAAPVEDRGNVKAPHKDRG